MTSALYYPTIRGRQGELSALHHLSPSARAVIAPLVDLPTSVASDPEALEEFVGSFVANLTPAWGTAYPIYIDLTRYDPGQLDTRGRHIAEHLFDYARQAQLKAIPVAGTLAERGPGDLYLQAVARAAKLADRGAALRISHADYSDSEALGCATGFGSRYCKTSGGRRVNSSRPMC